MLKQIAQLARVVVGLICTVTLASCAVFVSEVDSFVQPDALTKKRYVLMLGNKDVDATDLQFIEFANYIEKILNERGFMKASQIAEADIVIFLSYGIGNPQTHLYSYTLPIWGQTGVSSSSTRGTVSTFGSVGTYQGTTTYTPTYGIIGYTSHIDSYTTYTRFLSLEAYDIAAYKQDQKMNQVWKISVVSTGSRNDLRLVFPYMAVAMKPYIATNTGKKVTVEVLENDPQVSQIRGSNPSPEKK